jgi:SAM-dependent methyltransferase
MEELTLVGRFYDDHPYPPPVDDLEAYRRTWDDARRRAESHLLWPAEAYRDDRHILVVGCGTTQAAHYALRWPHARVVGIDFSPSSIALALDLKRTHGLDNLKIQQLAVESAGELGQTFELVVCTGVLHHLPDPEAGLMSLRQVMAPNSALHLMVYAPYGRAGVYLLQDYCRHLGIGWGDSEVRDLALTLKALPQDHPIVPLLRNSPDFADRAALSDALLNPLDRSYTAEQVMDLLKAAGLVFGRWVRQAPYLPQCGAIAATPHAARLFALQPKEQYAAMELFRGAMVRHSLVAYKEERYTQAQAVNFESDAWLGYIPIRLPDTIAVKDRLPAGAAAVLINRNHTFTDLYLPVDKQRERLIAAVDGERTIADICRHPDERKLGHKFFQQLWQYDQVVFDVRNDYPT